MVGGQQGKKREGHQRIDIEIAIGTVLFKTPIKITKSLGMENKRERKDRGPVFAQGKVIKDRFEICKHIGQGGYGDIYSALDRDTNKQCAVKIEYINAPKQALSEEIRIMLNLKHLDYLPTLLSHGVDEDFRFLAMNLFGPSLSAMRRVLKQRRFSLSTALRLSLEMLNCIEEFHRNGYIHRDIKPGNFLIRADRHRPICMIDFGLSQAYINPATKSHVYPMQEVGFTGTCRYASLNAHNERQLSRRDDLVSWFYSVLELVNGALPWPGSKDKDATITMKATIPVSELCASLPSVWKKIWQNINSLKFKEEPKYDKIKRLIRNSIASLETNAAVYDWEVLDPKVIQSISEISLVMETAPISDTVEDIGGCECAIA